MRTVLFLAAVLFMAPIRSGVAQQPAVTASTQTASGLHAVTFHLPQGTIRANFPDDLAAGDTISGTVNAEPSGATPAQRESNSGELTGYVIDVDQQKTPVKDKALRWSVPPATAGGMALVILRTPSGDPVAQSPIPVGVPSPSPRATDFDLPTTSGSGVATARGPFDGDFRTTSVRVGSENANLLAESPRKVVFEPPPGQFGPSTLEVRTGDRMASTPFRTIGVLPTITNSVLKTGQTAVATITVKGLQELSEPADLLLFNRSPGVVNLQGGVEQRLTIQPRQVRPDGTFVLTRTVTGVMVGAMDILVVANRRPTLQFDLPKAVDHSLADWQKTTGVAIAPDAQQAIGKSVADARGALDDFLRVQESYRGDPGAITDAIVRSYCFELRDTKPRQLARPLTVKFLAQQRGSASATTITGDDVNRNRFGQFFSKLLSRLSPNQPVAYLLVSSTPEQAPISIDNQPGPNWTNRKFMVSVGTHLVVVTMPSKMCRNSVEVQPFQTGNVTCQ
jgi:hypothetical protein